MAARGKSESSLFSLYCLTKCFQKAVTSTSAEKGPEPEEMHGNGLSDSKKAAKKKPGGWKSMPFILGHSLSFLIVVDCKLNLLFMITKSDVQEMKHLRG